MTSAETTTGRPAARSPDDRRTTLELVLVGLGLAVLLLPTWFDLARGPWTDPHESHGPFIIAIAAGAAFARRRAFLATSGSSPIIGTLTIIFGLLLYVVGRSQEFLVFETAAQLPILAGVVLCLRGWQGLRVFWFPVLFMLFAIVWPGWLIDRITLPLKQWATDFTVDTLFNAGYPISSTGVTIMAGQYKLLVADACSGLNTLISLMSVGVLYLYMVRNSGWPRDVALLVATPFIAIAANVLRVMALSLIYYHFGSDVGESFLHDFTGLFLFGVALGLIFLLDGVFDRARRLGAWLRARKAGKGGAQ
ncbi:MAG: exosortase [Alphaproteobacteria bacterium]